LDFMPGWRLVRRDLRSWTVSTGAALVEGAALSFVEGAALSFVEGVQTASAVRYPITMTEWGGGARCVRPAYG